VFVIKVAAVISAVMLLAAACGSRSVATDRITADAPALAEATGPLQVSNDGRTLVRQDGSAFFLLGDTAWMLARAYTRDEIVTYLDDRAKKRFNVVLVSALYDLEDVDGPNTANAYGRRPFLNNDPSRPDLSPGASPANAAEYDYWDHLDFVVAEANARGIYVGLLPTWGDRVNDAAKRTFTTQNARAYGAFIGARYRTAQNIIWVLGGDRPVVDKGVSYLGVWQEMAAGIREGAGGDPVITYHPAHFGSSGQWLHDQPWLTFNMFQSGHSKRDLPVWEMIATDWARSPAKPVLDAEPNYEDHPVNWNPNQGFFRDADVRRTAYWSVFAGGFGVVYGHHSIWQKAAPDRAPWSAPDRPWQEGLERPGSSQMTHLRNLMESRPLLGRVPDHTLIASHGDGGWHVQATRGGDGSYAMFYVVAPNQTFTIDPRSLSGRTLRAWWYDPRSGRATEIRTLPTSTPQQFTTPRDGPDWVLVLDDVDRGYPPPGTRR
jgi:hypothetical protein